ncbi:glycosyltransferase family A protein [Mycobacterium tuberculosis]|uniref:glycosyltransferase family A protein n=1 Tax=Mycobacterium tuberculosis TaxID=1773 RepID=UPI00272B84F4|nr:glycosyltransferase family A protein [Mycobacterium tuberculosis]
MYNAGILLAQGEICVICDSDAMVRPGFIRSIISSFEAAPDIVLHIDQFRNSRRDLYPFDDATEPGDFVRVAESGFEVRAHESNHPLRQVHHKAPLRVLQRQP